MYPAEYLRTAARGPMIKWQAGALGHGANFRRRPW